MNKGSVLQFIEICTNMHGNTVYKLKKLFEKDQQA